MHDSTKKVEEYMLTLLDLIHCWQINPYAFLIDKNIKLVIRVSFSDNIPIEFLFCIAF